MREAIGDTLARIILTWSAVLLGMSAGVGYAYASDRPLVIALKCPSGTDGALEITSMNASGNIFRTHVTIQKNIPTILIKSQAQASGQPFVQTLVKDLRININTVDTTALTEDRKGHLAANSAIQMIVLRQRDDTCRGEDRDGVFARIKANRTALGLK